MTDLTNGAVTKDNDSSPGMAGPRVVVVFKVVLWLVAIAYLLTSIVIVINAFVWLPGLPSAWYTIQRALYWPFQPYLKLMGQLLGSPSISYGAFVLISRAPFIIGTVAIMVVLIKRMKTKRV